MPVNNTFTPAEDKGGELAKELESRKLYVDNWIKHPEFKRRAIASLNRNAGKVPLGEVSRDLRFDFVANTSEEYTDAFLKKADERLKTVKYNAGDFAEGSTRKGEYLTEKHAVNVAQEDFNREGNQSGRTSVHEFTHASRADEAVPAMNVYDPDTVNLNDFHNPGYVDYLRQGEEVYSKLMEMRYQLGIQPGQTFTFKEVEKMRDNRNESMQLFDIFDDYEIQDMLNNWSANEGLDPNTIG